MKEYNSFSEEETYNIGKKVGEQAKNGEIYCLLGDLGVGKTVFTKGFAKGLGIEEHITSPTFTIVNEYDNKNKPLYHFDVYRIEDAYELEDIGYEEYFYGQGICLIEWAGKIKEILPEEYSIIKIEKDLEKGFDYRKITLKGNK